MSLDDCWLCVNRHSGATYSTACPRSPNRMESASWHGLESSCFWHDILHFRRLRPSCLCVVWPVVSLEHCPQSLVLASCLRPLRTISSLEALALGSPNPVSCLPLCFYVNFQIIPLTKVCFYFFLIKKKLFKNKDILFVDSGGFW